MKLEIDLKLLEETRLSPDDYIFLYLLWRKGLGYFDTIKFRIKATRLRDDGWITIGDENDINSFIIQQKFIDLFVSNFDAMFKELVDLYPFKVQTAKGSVRILRAKDPNAHSNKKAKGKYKRIVTNKPHLHRHIIKCLKIQLNNEKNNLGYMQNFETWINNFTWEKYEDLNINNNEERITRQL